MKQEYVAGFAFDYATNKVALIEKQKPEFQKGLWNGIGGKIEPGETPHQAMVREFEEEAGVLIDQWDYRIVLNTNTAIIHTFSREWNSLHLLKSMEEEKICLFDIDHIPNKTMLNVKWMLPFCLDYRIIQKEPLQVSYIEG